MTTCIMHDLALLDRLSSKSFLTHHERIPIAVHEHFQRNVEFLAIAEDRLVNRRQACRTRVEVTPGIDVSGSLPGAVEELRSRAIADRPVPPTGTISCLKHRALETCFLQFISGDQPRHAPAKNDNSRAFAQFPG